MSNSNDQDFEAGTTKDIPNWNEVLSTNWPALLFLTISPIAALASAGLYIYYIGLFPGDIALWIGMHYIVGLGITAGYHRYYSHRTHDAHPILQMFYLLAGTAVMQERVLLWARNHRIHHRHADTGLDPHNIKDGFFHAHMGWIFQNRPIDSDFSCVKDLAQNRLVIWQNKYYWPLFFIFGVGMPTFLGWVLFDRALGGFVWGALVRIIVQNHTIYSINSIAHTFGKKTYSLTAEARDSWFLALFSNGEGYHSYHHRFASDYRNGHKWYHWDPSKWFIGGMSFIGLASGLKRTPEAAVMRARLAVEHEQIAKSLALLPPDRRTYWSEKVNESKAQLESVLLRLQDARQRFRDYKTLRRQQALETSRIEYKALKTKLIECKRELQASQHHWSSLVASATLFIR